MDIKEKICRLCKKKLKDEDNIFPSRVKKYDWICKSCSKSANREYYRNKAKKRQKEDTDAET